MNQSINQTLSYYYDIRFNVDGRIGFIFLSSLLHGFSLAMIIGIVVGTYSSIYVAGSLALALSTRQHLCLLLKSCWMVAVESLILMKES